MRFYVARLLIVVLLSATTAACLHVAPQATLQQVTTQEVAVRVGQPGWVIVDVRDSNTFNGWPSGPQSPGGHIPGAKNFDLNWVTDQRDGLRQLAVAKGLTSNKIILYGNTLDEAQVVANWLSKDLQLSSDQLFFYAGGFQVWSAEQGLEVDKLARYETLVPASWLYEQIRAGHTQGFRIVEVSWDKEDEFRSGHLPGAVYLDSNRIEVEPFWNVRSAEELEATLLSLGITRNTLVVVYGRDVTAAARAAVVMMYFGVTDVRLLNGGFQAWLDAGFELERGAADSVATTDFGRPLLTHPEWIVGIDEARAVLENPDGRLVSARTWAEYVGEKNDYAYNKTKGRIPGASWGRGGPVTGMDESFRNPDGTMRNYQEIEANWKLWDITRDQQLSFFCVTGWRASEAFMLAYLMGFEKISVFDGGWHEWSSDEGNPIASGPPGRQP